MDALAEEPDGRRVALIIATSSYSDPTLARLRAPGHDAKDLAEVLADHTIGQFDVDSLLDASVHTIRRRIAQFCAQRSPRDLALIYLSCHGVLDDRGRLYYATADTDRELLSVTAVQAAWLNEHLDDCRCRRQILILDCCHSGAFAKGAKGNSALALRERFEGRGRIVLTASRGTEYSFEGSQVVGYGEASIFTAALVDGLRTGDADRDRDSLITVNELYDYAFDAVKASGARQNPSLWSYATEGSFVVARNPRKTIIEPTPLPEHVRTGLESPLRAVREAAVAELADMLAGPDAGRALTARQELLRIVREGIPLVDSVARSLLDAQSEPAVARDPTVAPGPAQPEPPATQWHTPVAEAKPTKAKPTPADANAAVAAAKPTPEAEVKPPASEPKLADDSYVQRDSGKHRGLARWHDKKVAVGLLAIVLIVIVPIVIMTTSAQSEAERRAEVATVLERYAQATRRKEYQTLCNDLYAKDLVERIRSAGLPCEVALRTGLEDRKNTSLTVRAIKTKGDTALARVRTAANGEKPANVTIRLVRENGGWRVMSLD